MDRGEEGALIYGNAKMHNQFHWLTWINRTAGLNRQGKSGVRMNMRDEFSEGARRKLAHRTGHFCSNPGCKQPTSGPSDTDKAVTIVGVAAHITAASKGGPRYNPSLTQE